MLTELQLRLKPEEAYNDMRLRALLSTQLNVDVNRITGVLVRRRSIDARQRQVMVNLSVTVSVDEPPLSPESLAVPVEYKPLAASAPQVVVVGAGPAGLFAALRHIALGARPMVLERGKDVDSRRPDMARISREGVVEPDSNYCFGEGGAGAFSDGKL
ncbi:MAG: FAD-binding protein, partial [Muribaculaceae bacterium]|nr:FAD-binding protein [Muribaculaceae bacterium]